MQACGSLCLQSIWGCVNAISVMAYLVIDYELLSSTLSHTLYVCQSFNYLVFYVLLYLIRIFWLWLSPLLIPVDFGHGIHQIMSILCHHIMQSCLPVTISD